MSRPDDHGTRIARAREALEGLSVGDAFGERFFTHPHLVEQLIAARAVPAPPWRYTDDTEMALAIVEVLEAAGSIDQDLLAATFARRYLANRFRGYGPAAHEILANIGAGIHWTAAAAAPFEGRGSLGNGGAMRAAPLGAYYADDLGAASAAASASAQVTHAHPEGQAGAAAVAVAAAWALQTRAERRAGFAGALLEAALDHTPAGATRDGIARALALPASADVAAAVAALGNGSRVSAPDTVPFALWCAARHLDDYVEAMWQTVSGLGDRDTTCAIVGGIVAAAGAAVPPDWRACRESLS
jgi:ADP-ribosylglycohydrolase